MYTGMNSPPEVSRYGPSKLRFSRRGSDRLIRNPPILKGQVIHCLLVFHSGPRNAIIEMSGLARRTPPFHPLSKEVSTVFARSVFDLVKADLESADPERIRAREMMDSLRLLRQR